MTFALEQDAQRFEHVALIIRNQNPAHALTLNRVSGPVSIAAGRKEDVYLRLVGRRRSLAAGSVHRHLLQTPALQ
jgi:hypothetical protein